MRSQDRAMHYSASRGKTPQNLTIVDLQIYTLNRMKVMYMYLLTIAAENSVHPM